MERANVPEGYAVAGELSLDGVTTLGNALDKVYEGLELLAGQTTKGPNGQRIPVNPHLSKQRAILQTFREQYGDQFPTVASGGEAGMQVAKELLELFAVLVVCELCPCPKCTAARAAVRHAYN